MNKLVNEKKNTRELEPKQRNNSKNQTKKLDGTAGYDWASKRISGLLVAVFMQVGCQKEPREMSGPLPRTELTWLTFQKYLSSFGTFIK